MIYTNRNYLRYKLNYSKLKDIDMWQAHWSEIKPVDTGDRLKIWQYGHGKVSGIEAKTDLNFGYFDTVEDYRKSVIEASGIEQQTVDYLNDYKYADDLWRKLYLAIK